MSCFSCRAFRRPPRRRASRDQAKVGGQQEGYVVHDSVPAAFTRVELEAARPSGPPSHVLPRSRSLRSNPQSDKRSFKKDAKKLGAKRRNSTEKVPKPASLLQAENGYLSDDSAVGSLCETRSLSTSPTQSTSSIYAFPAPFDRTDISPIFREIVRNSQYYDTNGYVDMDYLSAQKRAPLRSFSNSDLNAVVPLSISPRDSDPHQYFEVPPPPKRNMSSSQSSLVEKFQSKLNSSLLSMSKENSYFHENESLSILSKHDHAAKGNLNSSLTNLSLGNQAPSYNIPLYNVPPPPRRIESTPLLNYDVPPSPRRANSNPKIHFTMLPMESPGDSRREETATTTYSHLTYDAPSLAKGSAVPKMFYGPPIPTKNSSFDLNYDVPPPPIKKYSDPGDNKTHNTFRQMSPDPRFNESSLPHVHFQAWHQKPCNCLRRSYSFHSEMAKNDFIRDNYDVVPKPIPVEVSGNIHFSKENSNKDTQEEYDYPKPPVPFVTNSEVYDVPPPPKKTEEKEDNNPKVLLTDSGPKTTNTENSGQKSGQRNLKSSIYALTNAGRNISALVSTLTLSRCCSQPKEELFQEVRTFLYHGEMIRAHAQRTSKPWLPALNRLLDNMREQESRLLTSPVNLDEISKATEAITKFLNERYRFLYQAKPPVAPKPKLREINKNVRRGSRTDISDLEQAVDSLTSLLTKRPPVPPASFVPSVKRLAVAAYRLVYLLDAYGQDSSHFCDAVKKMVDTAKVAVESFPLAAPLKALMDQARYLVPAARNTLQESQSHFTSGGP